MTTTEKITTALVRAIDVPYQAGRMTADLEFQMVSRGIEAKDFDLGLHRKLREIDIKTLYFAPLQQAEYERARAERSRELSPLLKELKDRSRPYRETHGTLIVHHGPNIREIVMLMEVPKEMLDKYPQYAPVPRQEEFHI